MSKDTSMLLESKRYGKVPDGMSYREIGKILGISHTHVKLIERNALNKLRIKFKQIMEQEERIC
jgi:DNA-directed RNA polymerase specialized sigma subunit